MNLKRIIAALAVLALPLGCSAESDTQTSSEQVGQVQQRLDDDCVSDFDCSAYCGMDGNCQEGCGLWSDVTCGSGTCRPGHPPGEYCAVGAHCGPIGGDIQNLTCKRDLPCVTSLDCDPLEHCDTTLNTCQY